MINVVKTKTDNVKMTFFQYSYVVSSGGGYVGSSRSSRTTFTHAVVAFEHDSMSLPKFTLRPEGIFDRLGEAIGWEGSRDIDFDQHPEFSKSFVLNGDNEPTMRNFFDREKLDFFAQRKEACIEAMGSLLIFAPPDLRQPQAGTNWRLFERRLFCFHCIRRSTPADFAAIRHFSSRSLFIDWRARSPEPGTGQCP